MNNQLIAAYYSVPNDRTFCVYEPEPTLYTIAELKKRGWFPIKEKSKLVLPLTHNLFEAECTLKNWLRKNCPAAQKANYTKRSIPFPHVERVATPLKKIAFEQ